MMTITEAIETLRANYPDACFEQLREAVDAAIIALKAQNATGDTISRQAAIDVVKHAWAKGLEPSQYIEIISSVEVEPTEEQIQKYILDHNLTHKIFEPVKRGRWIPHSEICREYIGTVLVNVEYDYWFCNACGYQVKGGQPMYNFCPNCGLKMEGAEEWQET